jgi:anti-sigma-K factor RskA
MPEEMHDLAAAYALDALDDIERRRFETHLAGCEACRREVAGFGDALGELASRSPAQPPPEMRDRVLARIEETPQESRRPPVPGSRNLLMAAAAAVVAVVAFAALLGGGVFDDPVDKVLAADDARQITLESDVVEGAVLTFSPELGQGVFAAQQLPAVGPDETYELWLIDEDGPTPAGLFTPHEDGSATVLVEGEVFPGLTLGLTVEPVAGSDAPTGDILIAEPIT